MELFALGTFVFGLRTLPVSTLQRSQEFRHPSVDRVGARPASQFVGVGDGRVTLAGVVPMEITGGTFGLDTIEAIANSGESRTLVTGYGEVLGEFVIVGIEDTRRDMFADGFPRVVEYTLSMKRVDEPTAVA